MANQPTIVVANLDDAKLKASIDEMVKNLDKGLNEMIENTNDAVKKMQASLQSVGNIKFGSGGSDGGSTRRTKKQQEEADAVKQTAKAYDQLAQTQQKSTQVKSARESYYAFVQGYKEQARALGSLIQQAEGAYSQAVGNKIMQLNMRLNDTRRTMQELHNEFQRERVTAMSTGDMTRVNALLERIRNVGAQIEHLKAELASVPTTMLVKSDEGRRLQALRDEHSRLLNIMREEVSVQQQQNVAVNNQVSAQEKLANKIKRQAEIIRERFKETGTGTATWGNAVIYDPNDARNAKIKQARLSIEDQLLQKHQEQVRVTNERLALEERERQAKQQTLGVTQQLAGAEQKVTEAQEKRSNTYQPKTFQSYDDLRESIAHVLKVRTQDVNLANAETASYDRLNASLKIMQQAYNKLGANDRASEQGRALAASIQEVQRALHKIQSQASRPVRLENILGFQPKTLDDIVYKIQMLQRYREGIDFTNPKTKGEIEQVNQALEKLRQEQSKILGQNKDMLASNNALVRSFNYMKNRLAFYFTVGASTQFVKSLIDIRSQYEMNERALGILINSAERGTQIFKELSEMALVSPYTLIELSSAAKQLVAYDIAAKDVVDTTRRLADMAAAVGVPMERLTYALGQIKAYGYLNSRDARMFANAGIPLVKQLADYYTQLEGKIISTADVYDRMKKKAISYNDVMSVVTKMTDEGGKFFDFQAKMAETLKVRLANLTLAWNNMLNEIGENQQGILTSTIGALKELFLHWKDISNVMNTLLVAFGLWKTAQAIGLLYIGELNTAMGAQVLLGQKLGKTLTSAAASTKSFITASGVAATAFLYVIADAFMTWQRNSEEIQKFNSSIADGAKEASEALYNMLHSSEMVDARLNAINGKLSSSDASKAWERIREQLELSALTSKDLIAQLMLEPDLNKRVAESFNLAERIESATNKLVDLNTQLKVTQDSFLYGLFGEGIAEDINDFTNRLETAAETEKVYIQSTGSVVEDAYIAFKGFFSDMKEKLGDSREEAEREIKNFAVNAADIIKDELGEEGLKDKIQVNEAIARVIRGFEQQFPNIRGKGKALFETMFNDIMAEEFGKSFDKQAYYYNKFLDQLKKDHASAFGDVTDDILKDTHKWTSAQKDAIEKTAEKVKKDLPEASQSAIDEILRQLNSTEFKVRIVAEMATTSLDKVQQQFKDKYINKPWVADDKEREKQEAAAQQKYGTLMRKNTETNVEYEKRISDERKKQLELSQKNADIIEKNKNKQDAYSKAVLEDAKIQKQTADDWLATAEEIEKAGGYDFRTKQETKKTKGNKKDLVLEALKQEIQLVEKLQGDYDKLAKSGASQSDALATIRGAYGNTIKKLNAELGGYGLPTIDITSLIVGKDPNKSLEHFKNTLSSLIDKGMLTLERSKEVEAVIEKLTLSAKTYNLDMITKGLNNELGKLKDEYELAIALDADPELGESFASLIGLDLDSLPRTVSEYAKRATDYLNEYMDKNKTGIQLPSVELTNQQLKDLKDMVDANELNAEVYERIKKVVNEVREARKKEMEEHIKEWNKLIEKYSEYEAKIKNIQNATAKERRELVRTYGSEVQKSTAVQLETQIRAENDPAARQALIGQLADLADQVSAGNPVAVKLKVAITNKDEQDIAKAGFEEFQKSPEWILATGDLATMSTKAIGLLIDKLSKYKKSAKNLDPKQIKQLNNALKSLYKEQRKANPFTAMATAIEQAKENAALFDDKIEDTKNKIKETEKEIAQAEKYGFDTTQMKEQLDSLKNALVELENAKDSFNSIDPSTIVEGINGAIAVAQKASEAFTDMMNALGGKNGSGDAQAINQMFTILGKAGSYAAMGAQIGGAYGAIIGGVLGAVSSVVTMFADEWSGNADITRAVQRSERAVKRLEIAYVDLKHAMDEAYGTAEIGAQRAIITNKELQLVELKRQLQLEESRKGKNRDADRILELKKQIKELEYDIIDSINDITNSMLGITSVGNAAETLVTNMITAFRKGEKYMDEYKQSFEDMIDNMIMKAIVSNVIGNRLQEMFDRIQSISEERAATQKEAYEEAYKEFERSKNLADSWGEYMEFYDFDPYADKVLGDKNKKITREQWEALWQKRLEYLNKQYEAAMTPTPDDVQSVKDDMKNWKDSVKEEFMAYMDAFGIKYGQDSTKQLSALQQGLQGMSESTANSLEAYMNGVSQQVYLQNDLLIQIRDVILGFDIDIQTATLGQILLQLQNSYQVQMSIQNMLEGALNPSGRAFMVELNS